MKRKRGNDSPSGLDAAREQQIGTTGYFGAPFYAESKSCIRNSSEYKRGSYWLSFIY